MSRGEEIARNLATVKDRVARAAEAAGRDAASVRLVAVSKTMPPEDLRAALAAGQLDLGENYAQELRDKRAALRDIQPAPRWHFIGPLQSNKVKYVAAGCALVHAVDSRALLDELNRRVPDGSTQDCLLQVNVAGEAQKRGAPPSEVGALLDAFASLPRLRCRGLMLIPPLTDDPEAARGAFAALRAIRDEQATHDRPGVDLEELSMGMSHDLEVAIAEGATIVRVGTAIFGERRRT